MIIPMFMLRVLSRLEDWGVKSQKKSNSITVYIVWCPSKLYESISLCELYTDEKVAEDRCEKINDGILPRRCCVSKQEISAEVLMKRTWYHGYLTWKTRITDDKKPEWSVE